VTCEIIRLDHDIERTDLEHIIPYSTARDIVLTSSPGVTLLECPCRAAREDPCRPTQVCMLVGGGDWVLEHHPDRARRATQREALELLQAEHERGHVHTAYFKDACDHRCCGGLTAMQDHGVPMVASSGFVAEVDEGACIACGDCEDACPFGAITLNGRAAGAIGLVPDERKGIPLDVRKIGVDTSEPEVEPAARRPKAFRPGQN
jgi:ferredoxin